MDIDIQDRAPEHKSGIVSSEAATVFDELMRTFDAYKAENEQRLAAIERGRADALNEEKTARISATLDQHQRRLDEITLKGARPPSETNERVASASQREHKSAFDSLRAQRRERRAARAGSQGDVGRLQSRRRLLVPLEIEQQIGERLTAISPIRAIASVRTISANVYKKPFMTAGPAVGWVGETDARTADHVADARSSCRSRRWSSTPCRRRPRRCSRTPRSIIDQWLAAEVEQAFAVQEGTAFVTGDGSNKPKGFLSYTTVANASWAWGNIGYIASGAAGAFPASNPSDVLVDLIYALKAGYRQNARVRDEPQDAGRDPQVQGHDRQLSVAAAGGRPAARPR